MRCNMGLGFLTLGDSIDVVLCPGCPTLSDWCVVFSNTSYTKFREPFQHHTYNSEHTAPPKTRLK